MHDTLPEDATLWRFIRDTAERVARLYDYRQITTPIVEDAAVFLHTAGDESDIVRKEVYLFEDRGGDALALRPEGTAAVCRAYLEHGMASRPQPVRLFYFGPFFRYDRPQAGRYRQLWQFGVEAIGTDSPAADAELIDLQLTLYRELGLTDLTLRINSIGTAETRRAFGKVLERHFLPHLGTLSVDSRRRFETNILRILDSKEDAQHEAVLSAPSILDHLSDEDRAHFDAVQRCLDDLGIAYAIDPRIVRGLDYYARTVWEVEPPGAGGQSTIGAGGRYDGLMEVLGGPPTPAVGFATGIERIALNMRERGLGPTTVPGPDLYLVVAGMEHGGQAMAIAARIRSRSGASVVVGDGRRSVGAQQRHATQISAKKWAWVGKREIESGEVIPRDLVAGVNLEAVPLDGDALSALLLWNDVIQALRLYLVARGASADDDSETAILQKAENDPFLGQNAWLGQLRRVRDYRNRIVHGDALSQIEWIEFSRWAATLAANLSGRARLP